jgi:hypothetical protein
VVDQYEELFASMAGQDSPRLPETASDLVTESERVGVRN